MRYVPVISLYVFVLQGMVDPGEQVSLTLQREFSEEALNSLAVPVSERAKIYERINKLFKSSGFQVCRRHARSCSLTYFSPWVPPGGSSKYFCFIFRSLKAMWTIRGTLTMLGWKQLLLTSMMSQVSKMSKIVASTVNNNNSNLLCSSFQDMVSLWIWNKCVLSGNVMSLLLLQATVWASCRCRLEMTQDTSSGLMLTRPSRSTRVIPISWSWSPKREKPTGNPGQKTLFRCYNEGNIQSLIALCVHVHEECIESKPYLKTWCETSWINLNISLCESLLCIIVLWLLYVCALYPVEQQCDASVLFITEVMKWIKLLEWKLSCSFWLAAMEEAKHETVTGKMLQSDTSPHYFCLHKLCKCIHR